MKKKLICLILILVAITGGILYKIINTNKIIPDYTIEYFDGFTPGTFYTISIDNEYNIQVIEQPGCSTVDCYNGTYKPASTKHKVDFNKENKKLLKDFIETLFKNKDSNKISLFGLEDEKLKEKDAYVINAIIFNNQELMKNYK